MGARQPLPFGVSQFTTTPWTFEDDLERLPLLGISTVEVVEDKLDPVRWPEQMRAVAQAGLTVSGVQASVRAVFPSRMMPGPRALRDRSDRFRSSIERLAPFVRGSTFVVNTGAPPNGDMAETLRTTAAFLRELAPVARDCGVTLALEPLNPTSMNVESAIWTVDQAMDIIEQVDRPEVGLCLDLWNVWENAKLPEQIARAGERIFTVQLGGWRTPRSFSDRVTVSEGKMPLAELLGLVTRTFDGPCVLELFHSDVDDAPNTEEIASIIDSSHRYFLSLWSPEAPSLSA